MPFIIGKEGEKFLVYEALPDMPTVSIHETREEAEAMLARLNEGDALLEELMGRFREWALATAAELGINRRTLLEYLGFQPGDYLLERIEQDG